MAQKPSAHPPLNNNERLVAALGGLGLTIAMTAAILGALGTADSVLGLGITQWAWIGLASIGMAVAVWLFLLQPWKEFDDLKTPYYTGHDHAHEAQADPAEIVADHEAQPDHIETLANHEAQPDHIETLHADDFTVIEGIGPATQAALVAGGITTFEQLAAADPAQLESLLQAANLPPSQPETWPKQASYVLNKDVQGLKAYQASIKTQGPQVVEDLQLIEGIGPKIKATLVAAGLSTFKQIAEADPAYLQEILMAAGLKLAKPQTWPKQARFIVEGDMVGLKDYQERLKGGVEQD
jgi:predicted flap endonuclease-1-like 5' DNA nuclease